MKRNFILLSVFIALLTIVNIYFKESDEQRHQNYLITQTQFQELVLSQFTILRNNQIYYLKDSLIPVDIQMMNTIWDYLKRLKIVSQIESHELSKTQLDDYLTEQHKFSIVENGMTRNYIIGKLNSYTNTIFCSVENGLDKKISYYFISDENPAPRAYGDEAQASEQKYQVLKTLINLEQNKMTDNTLFPDNLLTDLGKIEFKVTDKREFTLDIINRKTNPEIFHGLIYLNEKIDSIQQYLASFKAEAVIAGYKNLLGKEMAKIVLIGKSGNQKIFSLHEGYNGQSGFYVSSNFQQFIYKLKATDKDFFYLIAQDFWDLTFKFPVIDSFVVFRKGNKTINLELSDPEVGEWLKLVSTQGIMAEDFIPFTDQFRKPDAKFKVFEMEHAQVNYEFFFDRVTWYVSHPILKGYLTFEKNQIPSQLELR